MSITKSVFGTKPDGSEVYKYKIKNSEGCFAEFITYGATWLSAFMYDKDDILQDVLLGFDDMEGHINRSDYQGQCVGRYANRIASGKFTVNGTEYQVDCNEDGVKSLHSSGEFAHANWSAEEDGENSVVFSFVSADGTYGFPGTLTAKCKYTLTDENEVVIEYSAVSDKATIINFTNHAYFNLAGCNSGDVLSHVLWIDADAFTPTTPDSIPTGEIRPVKGTPYDFTDGKTIGEDIKADYDQLTAARGYDHNFCLNEGDDYKIAVLEPVSGRTLTVWTDQPGVQLYTGNFLDGTKAGKGGCPMIQHAGFCLETQVYPDAPNHDNFPQCTYQAGEEYTAKTIYKFGIKD